MAHEKKIEKITLYETVDGKVFESKDSALEHENDILGDEEERVTNIKMTNALIENYEKYLSHNDYYAIVDKQYLKHKVYSKASTATPSEILYSLFVDTPEHTLRLLLDMKDKDLKDYEVISDEEVEIVKK